LPFAVWNSACWDRHSSADPSRVAGVSTAMNRYPIPVLAAVSTPCDTHGTAKTPLLEFAPEGKKACGGQIKRAERHVAALATQFQAFGEHAAEPHQGACETSDGSSPGKLLPRPFSERTSPDGVATEESDSTVERLSAPPTAAFLSVRPSDTQS
jgi:hypothetical protein